MVVGTIDGMTARELVNSGFRSPPSDADRAASLGPTHDGRAP